MGMWRGTIIPDAGAENNGKWCKKWHLHAGMPRTPHLAGSPGLQPLLYERDLLDAIEPSLDTVSFRFHNSDMAIRDFNRMSCLLISPHPNCRALSKMFSCLFFPYGFAFLVVWMALGKTYFISCMLI